MDSKTGVCEFSEGSRVSSRTKTKGNMFLGAHAPCEAPWCGNGTEKKCVIFSVAFRKPVQGRTHREKALKSEELEASSGQPTVVLGPLN